MTDLAGLDLSTVLAPALGLGASGALLAVRGTADNPMTQAEIEVKAFDLIETVLGARKAKAILRAIASLETVADVAELRRLWQPSYDTRPGPRA